jgi:hypothetical protein
LKLTFGIDHFGSSFPLGLSLPGHGPLHLRGQINMFELHGCNLDAPGICMGIEYFLKLVVDLFPL